MSRSKALVTGGSGVVGSEVVRALRGAGLEVDFTYLRGADRAQALAGETGARSHQVDLRRPADLRALLGRLGDLDVLVHCAAVSRGAPLEALTDDDWDDAQRVNVQAAFVACQALAPSFARAGGGDVVLVGALDRGQSLPIPAHFAATQGMLAALVMALAKELGPGNTRVNMVALGPLEGGLSRELPPKLIENYRSFSALRRLGRPAEVARAIRWLALENGYMSGKVVPVNGGI